MLFTLERADRERENNSCPAHQIEVQKCWTMYTSSLYRVDRPAQPNLPLSPSWQAGEKEAMEATAALSTDATQALLLCEVMSRVHSIKLSSRVVRIENKFPEILLFQNNRLNKLGSLLQSWNNVRGPLSFCSTSKERN